MNRASYGALGLVALVVTGTASRQSAHAQGAISIVTNKATGTPLVMAAGGVSSDSMIVSVNSDASDLIQGWKINLWILPICGTGTVGFNSSVQPANYVFGTRGALYTENLKFPVNDDGMFAGVQGDGSG